MILSDFLKQGAIVSLSEGSLLLAWGKGTRRVEPSVDLPSFYVTDFFLEQPKPWVTFDSYAILSPQELSARLGKAEPQPHFAWKNPFNPFFKSVFSELQNFFGDKQLEKAVPYIYETADALPNVQSSLVSALDQIAIAPLHLYGLWSEQEGILGLTPEHLFRKKDNCLHTVALAGTGSPETVWSGKNRREHQIVIDAIIEALKPFGTLHIGPTQQVDFPILSHLATPITLNALIRFETAVQALHPTPALGATPAPMGNKWLKAYGQRLPRFYYGAPWGIRYGQDECCYVAIRNMQWSTAGTFLAAGCGVVPESQESAEWDEIAVKLKAIKKGLGL